MENTNKGTVVPVDIRKLSGGIQQIFLGCASVFDSLGAKLDGKMLPDLKPVDLLDAETDEPQKQPDETAVEANDTGQETDETSKEADETAKEADAETTEKTSEAKASTAAPTTEAAPKANASTVTVNDIIKIASAKITANRKNSEKIQKLIASYGVSKMSELPEDKFEAFLTDISQL